ncbi:maleylacetoacetate isomerase [Cupriavidus sp. 8B]
MELYNDFNSSTSYRVRIALALKKVDYGYIPIDLRSAASRENSYMELNRAGGVPLLVDDHFSLSQSLAIIDHLDRTLPGPRLIPEDPVVRARALELSYAVACDIHSINNLRVLQYLRDKLEIQDERRAEWYRHWVKEGLSSVEDLLQRYRFGELCFGDQPTVAECCLVPQVTNALRMGCDLGNFTLVGQVHAACMKRCEFTATAPAFQPDYRP